METGLAQMALAHLGFGPADISREVERVNGGPHGFLDAADNSAIGFDFVGHLQRRFHLLIGAAHQEFTGRDQRHLHADAVRFDDVGAEMLGPRLLMGASLLGVERGFGGWWRGADDFDRGLR